MIHRKGEAAKKAKILAEILVGAYGDHALRWLDEIEREAHAKAGANVKSGFTGEITDSLGRRYYFVNGHRVPRHQFQAISQGGTSAQGQAASGGGGAGGKKPGGGGKPETGGGVQSPIEGRAPSGRPSSGGRAARAQVYQETKEKVQKLLKGKKSKDAMSEMVLSLSQLSLAELFKLKNELGVSGWSNAGQKPDIVAKVAKKLEALFEGGEEEAKPPSPPPEKKPEESTYPVLPPEKKPEEKPPEKKPRSMKESLDEYKIGDSLADKVLQYANSMDYDNAKRKWEDEAKKQLAPIREKIDQVKDEIEKITKVIKQSEEGIDKVGAILKESNLSKLLKDLETAQKKLTAPYECQEEARKQFDMIHKALAVDKPVDLTQQIDLSGFGPRQAQYHHIKKGMGFLCSLTAHSSAGEDLFKVPVKVTLSIRGRSGYSKKVAHNRPGDGGVTVPAGSSIVDLYDHRDPWKRHEIEGAVDNEATTAHELAHHLEEEIPGVRQACYDFLDHRCGNETPRWMGDVAPGAGYGTSEYGRKDDFEKLFPILEKYNAYYVGKDYSKAGINATEVLSMGVEFLYRNPIHFAVVDPEYFKFVVGVLRGDIRGTPKPGKKTVTPEVAKVHVGHDVSSEARDDNGKWTAGGGKNPVSDTVSNEDKRRAGGRSSMQQKPPSNARKDPAANRPTLPSERRNVKPPSKEMVLPPPPKGKAGGLAGGMSSTGHTNTIIGDMAEALLAHLGLRDICPEGKRQNPLDVEYDHSGYAFEVKSCTTAATEYKAKGKAVEMENKRAYAKKHGLKPATMIAVVDLEKREVHAYWRPGIGAWSLTPGNAKKWNYMGTVKSSKSEMVALLHQAEEEDRKKDKNKETEVVGVKGKEVPGGGKVPQRNGSGRSGEKNGEVESGHKGEGNRGSIQVPYQSAQHGL